MIGKLRWLLPALAVAASMPGCKPEDEIRTYTVEKEPDRAARPPGGEAGMRMLAGIVPLSDGASYFVRFLGPVETVSPREADFDLFLKSIRLTDDPKRPLTWIVPPNWKVGPPRDKRVVTIHPDGDKKAEIYISEPFGGSVLDNVNRWRTNFLGLKAMTASELEPLAQPVALGGKKALRFDLRGPGGAGGMAGPVGGTN